MSNHSGLFRCARFTAHVLCASLTLLETAQAQNKPFSPPSQIIEDEADGIGFRAGSLVLAPIPFESPSFGSGLALGGAYLFKNDRLSDASSIGFGAFKSSNDSQGFGLGLNLSWDEDDWATKILLADADLNYDLFVGEAAIPVSQSLRGGSLEISHSVRENISVGSSLAYGEYRLNLTQNGVLPPVFAADSSLNIARLSAFAEFDTRDDTFYPTTGALLIGTLTRGNYVDNDRSGYSKAVLSASAYLPVFSQSVLAAHAVACRASDDAPFFDACSLGVTDNFRGYVATEFLDQSLVSFQGEFRGRLYKRLGYVAFVGAGSVGGDLGAAFTGDFKAAAGLGIRIRLSKSFPLDYAIDMARNERGEELLYISVGQRF
ncbi:MAG: BamA/TamA family outer membrane protein [Paracoccaceae bacterium]